jgi:site-specific recombinase XerD
MLHFRNKPLPEIAEKYLIELGTNRSKNTINLHRASLHHFYRFLAQSKLEIANLKITDVAEFDEDLSRHFLKMITRKNIIAQVHQFIRWLEQNDAVPDISKTLFPNYHPDQYKAQVAVLPSLAEKFIEVLSSTSKENTVKGYQSCLRGFYKIHYKTNKKPYQINRDDVEALMIDLKNRKMGVNQRFGRLVQFRRYLDWLYDHRKLKANPDELLNSKDFPKRVEMLPRPFPVDVDLEIQRRLGLSDDIDHLGLLLMRRTGIRAGELRDLTLNCIENDFHKNWFLKVPLGKLNNERIIPLDPKTVSIIERIQANHSQRPERTSEKKYLISNSSGNRRGVNHFTPALQDICKGLAIPGKVTPHRLRHSFATSLLSAGISITSLKKLLGHRDIRMTLGYAAVTQETLRNEYFEALNKIQAKYEVASYPLKVPDLNVGMNRCFYDAQKLAKKIAQDKNDLDNPAFKRLCYRLMVLKQDFCTLLDLQEK